jgi:hypothetical protein
MNRTQENAEMRNREEVRSKLCENSTNRLGFSEVYDALDLRLIDTFPASDAIAQY